MREIIRRQTAARAYPCDTCGSWIKSASAYLRFSVPPQDGQAGWHVYRECVTCTTRAGRAGLLDEMKESK